MTFDSKLQDGINEQFSMSLSKLSLISVLHLEKGSICS